MGGDFAGPLDAPEDAKAALSVAKGLATLSADLAKRTVFRLNPGK